MINPFFSDPKLATNLQERMLHLGHNWGWVFAMGIVCVVLGLFAFNAPFASTLGLTWALGALLFATGIAQIVQSFRLRHMPGTAGRFLEAAISLITGGLMLRYPVAGMMGIGIALSFFFLMSGAGKWMIAMDLRPHSGWGWMMMSSIASFVLGVLMIAMFPVSTFWVPGALLGIDLVLTGISAIGLSLQFRNIHKAIEHRVVPEEERPKRAA